MFESLGEEREQLVKQCVTENDRNSFIHCAEMQQT